MTFRLAAHIRRPAVVGVGSGILGAAAVLARGGGTGLVRLVPAMPTSFGSLVVPFFSLLALVGPTGLTFPCWAHDTRSPGARAARWLRDRLVP